MIIKLEEGVYLTPKGEIVRTKDAIALPNEASFLEAKKIASERGALPTTFEEVVESYSTFEAEEIQDQGESFALFCTEVLAACKVLQYAPLWDQDYTH